MKILLKKLTISMVTKKYANWLNDERINKFTEQKINRHTVKTVKKYVSESNKSKNNCLMGIFVIEKKRLNHVGNIKLGNINLHHKFAEISYFIGNLQYQNKGVATLAISKMIDYAKKKYIINIYAGTYEMNIASQKVLEKNNFKLEARFKKKLIYKHMRCDHLIYKLKLNP